MGNNRKPLNDCFFGSSGGNLFNVAIVIVALFSLWAASYNFDGCVYSTLLYQPFLANPRIVTPILIVGAVATFWGWAVVREGHALGCLARAAWPLTLLAPALLFAPSAGSYWNIHLLGTLVGVCVYLSLKDFKKPLGLSWGTAWLIAVVATAGFVIWTSWLQHYAFDRFMLHYYDVGIYFKRVNNAIDFGSFHQVSSAAPRFFYHFSPGLALLIPVMLVFPTVKVLIIVQCLFMGLTGLVLFAVAKGRNASPTAALSICLCFLLYPASSQQTYNFGCGFHPLTIALPMTVAALHFIVAKRFLPAAALVALSLTMQEHVAVYFLGFGLILLLTKSHKTVGGVLAACSLTYFLVVTKWIMPPGESGDVQAVGLIWGHLGDTMVEVALSPFRRPEAFWGTLFQRANLHLALAMFAPLLFICFLRWEFVLALAPIFLFNFLRVDQISKSISFQYNTLTMAFVFVALILTLPRNPRGGDLEFIPFKSCLKRLSDRLNPKALLGAAVAACFTYSFFNGLLPWSRLANAMPAIQSRELMDRRRQVKRDILALIPRERTVTSDDLTRILFMNHRLVVEPDDDRGRETDYHVYQITGSEERRRLFSRQLERMLRDENYQLVYQKHGFFVFKRVTPTPPLPDDVF